MKGLEVIVSAEKPECDIIELPKCIDWDDLVDRSVGCQTKESYFVLHLGKKGDRRSWRKGLSKRQKALQTSQQLLQGMF